MAINRLGIKRVVSAVADDLEASLRWKRDRVDAFIASNGSAVEYAAHADDLLTLAYQVVGNVQEAIQELNIDDLWPACPHHGSHPMTFDYDLVWRCPSEDANDPAGFMSGVPLGWLDTVLMHERWQER